MFMRTRPSLSAFVEPCLPAAAARPPSGPGWLHEINTSGVWLFTRRGNDWSFRFPSALDAVSSLKVRSCLIDGEMAVLDGNGLAVFSALRRDGRLNSAACLLAFDLPELDGDDLRSWPIEERKAALARVLRSSPAGLRLCEHLDGDGPTIFEHACQLGYEGIVSKRLGSPYRSGRSHDWLKVKNPECPAARREAEEAQK